MVVGMWWCVGCGGVWVVVVCVCVCASCGGVWVDGTKAVERCGDGVLHRHCGIHIVAFDNSTSPEPFEELTAVGFEPTPLRTGALSQRLRPLGQTVLSEVQTVELHCVAVIILF